eukprot:TRINITY_DN28635_c0_g1_i1.p1 TRINITY_DN28635_c0_g1~~TRINITY_DN28635_c0_g1_i1.p1  ORF type:complete len:191 (+),score=31.64 TRINITY_DN28635_c0_g1_i1:41-613(+)
MKVFVDLLSGAEVLCDAFDIKYWLDGFLLCVVGNVNVFDDDDDGHDLAMSEPQLDVAHLMDLRETPLATEEQLRGELRSYESAVLHSVLIPHWHFPAERQTLRLICGILQRGMPYEVAALCLCYLGDLLALQRFRENLRAAEERAVADFSSVRLFHPRTGSPSMPILCFVAPEQRPLLWFFAEGLGVHHY